MIAIFISHFKSIEVIFITLLTFGSSIKTTAIVKMEEFVFLEDADVRFLILERSVINLDAKDLFVITILTLEIRKYVIIAHRMGSVMEPQENVNATVITKGTIAV